MQVLIYLSTCTLHELWTQATQSRGGSDPEIETPRKHKTCLGVRRLREPLAACFTPKHLSQGREEQQAGGSVGQELEGPFSGMTNCQFLPAVNWTEAANEHAVTFTWQSVLSGMTGRLRIGI